MRRQRSVSFFADTQEEFFEEMNNNKKSISERRRCRSNSYQFNNSNKSDNSKNSEYLLKKKYFQSYDDLEIEQLGVNSTYQLAKLENQVIEDDDDDEGGFIKKIKNINVSFKEINNNSFFSNLTPFTKNIIGKIGHKTNKKTVSFHKKYSNHPFKFMFQNKQKNNNGNNNNNEDIDPEEEEYLAGIGHRSYQMRYLGLKNPQKEINNSKKEKSNLINENNNKGEENSSFNDTLKIDELENENIKNKDNVNVENNEIKEISEINNDDIIKEDNEELDMKKESSSNSYDNSEDEFEIKTDKTLENPLKKDDIRKRKFTFDINTFIPNSGEIKDEGDKNIDQYKALQNFISNNEFLSKNIDYVDEHLKFLITGNDMKSKQLFLNALLNIKSKNDDSNIESINIIKKVIKLLGDYIKLELYEENCNLCYSHMLQTYVDFSDGIIFILNINDVKSAKYIYDIIDKLKYKINKDKRHFNTVLLCFNIIEEDQKDLNNDDNQIEINSETYIIIDKIFNDFDIKPNYITMNINNDEKLKNEKFEFVINKFLSLAYLKKERKRKPKDSSYKRRMSLI